MTQSDTLATTALSEACDCGATVPTPADAPLLAAVDPFAGLPAQAERARLLARGWSFEPTPQGCVLRKFAPGYPAKVHVVSAQAVSESQFETFGVVLLHGQSCSRTSVALVSRERLFERLSALLEQTEALTVFDDAGF